MSAPKNESKAVKPLSIGWWITLLVGAAATVLAAVAPEVYRDAKAWVLPGDVFGSYILLSPDEDAPEKVRASALRMKSHGYKMWGYESAGRKSWVYTGYINLGYLVFSYRSEDSLGIGFGEYFLEPKDGQRAEFIGQMVGNFCDHKGQVPSRRIMQCNVVMVRGEPGGMEEKNARDFYRQFLSKPCVLKDEAKQVPLDKCAKPAQ